MPDSSTPTPEQLKTALRNWREVADVMGDTTDTWSPEIPATVAELRLILAAAARDADVVMVPRMVSGK